MVFLLLFAVMAATSMRSSMSSVQAISNMQWRTEGTAAANDTIDRLLSSDAFSEDPVGITNAAATIDTTPYAIDANGDGVADIRVTFPQVTIAGVTKAGPRCIRYRPVPNASLDPESPADQGCFGSSSGEPSGLGKVVEGSGATEGMGTSQSSCADTQWVIPVLATDTVTNTSVTVSQGVSIRKGTDVAESYCN
jgi:hypothetical protein